MAFGDAVLAAFGRVTGGLLLNELVVLLTENHAALTTRAMRTMAPFRGRDTEASVARGTCSRGPASLADDGRLLPSLGDTRRRWRDRADRSIDEVRAVEVVKP